MFALPIYAAGNVTDVAATAAIVQGVNDNVIQTTDNSGDIDRHPATFTGLDGTFTFRITEPDTDVHGLRLRVRGQYYQSLDGSRTTDPDGTFQAVYASSITLTRFTTLTLSASNTITALTSARVGDGTLFFTVDPSTTQTTFTLTQGSATLVQELGQRWRLRQSGGILVTSTVSAPPFILAGGQELDRKGIDGVQPFSTTSVLHDISPRNTGDISVTYRYTYAPYSLDFRSSPPRAAGPQRIHQVIPDVGLTHLFTPDWLSLSRVGLSVSSAPNFSDSNKPVILPVVSEEIHFTNERWAFISAASFSYGSVTPRLGSGPTFSAQASLVGTPYPHGKFRNLMMTVQAVATHASLQASGSASTSINAAGASIEGRYPLTKGLGLSAGYDIRLSTIQTTGADLVPFFRQILFIGLSGYLTTDGTIPVLQLLNSPFRPAGG
ncbi:hypothetical protein LZC95_38205 [Pendulispora brunnea]|uniref:Uncharacterized protein n=1 Tax=Pendulispora brunnea TaxID=2905690 RepID=A0ABZ2K0Z3_9BACT